MKTELEIGIELADRICRTVRPVIGIRTKKLYQTGISGDYQYLVDERAEKGIREFFESLWKEGKNYGYVTEDQGLVLPPTRECEVIFEIDPIDGSRPAQRGMGTSCFVLGIVPYQGRTPTLADVEIGVVRPLLEDGTYVADKKSGDVFKLEDGRKEGLKLSPVDELSQCFVDLETIYAPHDVMGKVYNPVVDATNAHFVYHSISYSLLSVARGEIEGIADVRLRVYKDFPSLRNRFKQPLKTSAALDICGIYPIVKMVGGISTDGYGNSLDNTPLWSFDEKGNWTKETSIHCITANNKIIYKQLLEKIEEGIKNLK